MISYHVLLNPFVFFGFLICIVTLVAIPVVIYETTLATRSHSFPSGRSRPMSRDAHDAHLERMRRDSDLMYWMMYW